MTERVFDTQGCLDTLADFGAKRVALRDARVAARALEAVLGGVFSAEHLPDAGEGFEWSWGRQGPDGFGPICGFSWTLENAALPEFRYCALSPFRAGLWLQRHGDDFMWAVSIRVFCTSADRSLADRFMAGFGERVRAAGEDVQILASRRVGAAQNAASIVVGLLPASCPAWLDRFSRMSGQLGAALRAGFREPTGREDFLEFARQFGYRAPDPHTCPTCGGPFAPADVADCADA